MNKSCHQSQTGLLPTVADCLVTTSRRLAAAFLILATTSLQLVVEVFNLT